MQDLWEKGKLLWARFSEVSVGTYASSIAYFAFLSLVPLIALCISIVSVAGFGEQEVAAFFVALVPDTLDDLVKTLVEDAFGRSVLAFSLSTVVLLWSASKGVKALRAGLNSAYGVRESRNAVEVAVISILVTLILGILFAAILYLVFSESMMRAFAGVAPALEGSDLLGVLNPVITLVLGVLVFDVCYAYLPAGTRRLSTQLPGAVLASLGCSALSFGFRLYVEHFSNVTVLYGSIATVALLLMWMYFVSIILIAGGFVNRVWDEGRQQ